MNRRMVMICDAYETGLMRGMQRDTGKGSDYYTDRELIKAFNVGHQMGEKRSIFLAPPDHPRIEELEKENASLKRENEQMRSVLSRMW
jgi:guanylate kinase